MGHKQIQKPHFSHFSENRYCNMVVKFIIKLKKAAEKLHMAGYRLIKYHQKS